MSNLLNNISSNSLLIICIVMTIVALFLAIAVAIEVIANYRRKKNVNIVSIAVDAPQDMISAMSGKIGKIDGVSVKTAYSNVITNE